MICGKTHGRATQPSHDLPARRMAFVSSSRSKHYSLVQNFVVHEVVYQRGRRSRRVPFMKLLCRARVPAGFWRCHARNLQSDGRAITIARRECGGLSSRSSSPEDQGSDDERKPTAVRNLDDVRAEERQIDDEEKA